ncbi:MAG: hypothetical protein ACRC2T_10060 [Thermoguttaceae bacterium]
MENTPKEEACMTRRKMIQVSAVGALVAVSGLHVVYQRSKSKPALASTEITIEGPFNEYGYFRPKDLGREDINKLDSDFVLEHVYLSAGKYFDEVIVSFTFAGTKNINRKMNVLLTVFDGKNNVIGEAKDIFSDPRTTETSGVINGFCVSTSATLVARLEIEKKSSRIAQVNSISISVVDLV